MSERIQRNLWVVNQDVPFESEDEYNTWYEEVHIPDILDVPGFVSGQRLRLAPTQFGNQEPELRRYLCVYEVEGDFAAAFAALGNAFAAGRIRPSGFQPTAFAAAAYEAVGPKITTEP